AAFVDQIAFGFLVANNFHSEVGAEPELVFPARIGGRKHQKEIGLTEFSRSNAESQWSEVDFAATRPNEVKACEIQELHDILLLIRRHRQHVEKAVGVFN